MSNSIYQDSNGNSYFIDEFGTKVYVNQQKKKKGFFRSLKDGFENWFEGLTDNQQIGVVCGTWFLAGLSWGGLFNELTNKKRNQMAKNTYYAIGHLEGQKDAYKEMAQNNPFNEAKVTEVKKF